MLAKRNHAEQKCRQRINIFIAAFTALVIGLIVALSGRSGPSESAEECCRRRLTGKSKLVVDAENVCRVDVRKRAASINKLTCEEGDPEHFTKGRRRSGANVVITGEISEKNLEVDKTPFLRPTDSTAVKHVDNQVSIKVATFNMAEPDLKTADIMVGALISELASSNPDLIVIGFQESHITDKWSGGLRGILNKHFTNREDEEKYTMRIKRDLTSCKGQVLQGIKHFFTRKQTTVKSLDMGIKLVIAQRDASDIKVHNIQTSARDHHQSWTGSAFAASNKGVVGARLKITKNGVTKTVSFANCHNSSDNPTANQRHFKDVLKFCNRKKMRADVQFIFGDVNYRLAGEQRGLFTDGWMRKGIKTGKKCKPKQLNAVNAMYRKIIGECGVTTNVKDNDLPKKMWELREETHHHDPDDTGLTLEELEGFKEYPITHMPTYPIKKNGGYSVGDQDEKKKGRVVSWTDRIYYKSKGDIITIQEQKAYDIFGSDHLPVSLECRI